MNPAVGHSPPLVCMRATNALGTRAALSANWKSPPATMPEIARIALAYSAPAEKFIVFSALCFCFSCCLLLL